MKMLSWNCRGAAKSDFHRRIMDLKGRHSPTIMLILETKLNGEAARVAATRCGFSNAHIVESDGRAGGMWLLWDEDEVAIDVMTSTRQGIHAIVKVRSHPILSKVYWFLSGVYGRPQFEIRSQLWEELRIVSKHFTGPWLVIGDFNDVVDSTEKFGGNPICQNRVKAYTDCMNDCNLLDLGYFGGRFTWVNMRDNSQIIRERIDRAWANPDWHLQFPEANVFHLPRVCSDHNPILLDFEHSGFKSGERPFRLEKFWLDHPNFKDLITPVWSSITSSTSQCVANTKSVCKIWSRNTFGHIFDKKRELNVRLNGIQKALSFKPSTFLSSLEKELSKEYANILKFEEDLWFMKSRTNWVVDGDRNSKFFHLSTIKHRSHNRIHCLRISTDEWVSDQREISNLIVHYFRDLFTSSLAHSYHDSFSLIGGLSSNTMASYVDDDIPSDKEIHDALFSLKPFKAPGPDGLHPMFFQKMWPVVAEILCSDIKNAFCLSSIPEGWNDCLISLIPKINNPETVQQFRPIGLCNTTYKIISKILVNRIKPILESLISPCQASFVPGRKGTDNILILQELVHSFSNKRGKVGDVIVKLDLEKAYDRLEWSFIREALVYFQFPHRVIDLIMSCISTSHITILVNGGKTEKLTPTRGIRQGDPLSPYLFILCMEFLSIKISGDMARGLWKGSKAGKRGPTLSHLFFADDLIFVGKASLSNCLYIKNLLNLFCARSGQKINTDKSRVFFSRNVDIET
ncbi:hypothetical protein SLE2022_147640 [Rubroshorea leprosula]